MEEDKRQTPVPSAAVNEDMEGEDVDSGSDGEEVEFLASGIKDIVYCPVCSLPPEFCEFNPAKVFNKCKPWLIKNFPDLYPHLKAEAAKKQRKARKPKGTFFPWTEIALFHNVRAAHATREVPVSFRGKIKLHGTNGAISVQNGSQVYVQSRNTFLSKEKDHHDFAKWALETKTKNYFKSLFQKGDGYWALTFFGEWCGKGIMKGASICDVDQRYFAVFAALLNKDRLITNPARIEELLHYSEKEVVPKEIVVIPWQTEEIALVFSDQQQLLPKIEILNELVDRVEKEDPWVKERFGVSGSGEGLVWYPLLDDEKGVIKGDVYASLVFKTKGLQHSVVGAKKSVQITPEVVDSVEAFVDLFLTEARLNQGWEEVCGEDAKKPDIKVIGDFVNWMSKDVEKESVAELRENNLTWSQASGLVALRSRKWFIAQLNRLGGVDVVIDADGEPSPSGEKEKGAS